MVLSLINYLLLSTLNLSALAKKVFILKFIAGKNWIRGRNKTTAIHTEL